MYFSFDFFYYIVSDHQNKNVHYLHQKERLFDEWIYSLS